MIVDERQASTCPSQIVVIDDLVGGVAADQLLEYAIAQESDFRPARVALAHEGVVDQSRRRSKISRRLDPVMPLIEAAMRIAVEAAIQKLGLVNVESYFLESELTWCGHGGFFKRHTDTLYRDRFVNPRVMTALYYLCRTPKPFSKGHLRVYGVGANANGCIEEVEPRKDRAVLFPSWYPHEVLPVHCTSNAFADGRFALVFWVRKI